MEQILLILLIIVSVTLIGLVLIQQGKGAGIGAAFGSGASNTMFGSAGSGSFLTKLTGFLAAAFFIISLALANIAVKKSQQVNSAPFSGTAIEQSE